MLDCTGCLVWCRAAPDGISVCFGEHQLLDHEFPGDAALLLDVVIPGQSCPGALEHLPHPSYDPSALLLPLQTAVEAETKVWQQAVKDGDAFGAAIACKLLEADHYRARMHAYYVAHLKASLRLLSCCTVPQLAHCLSCAQAVADALSSAEPLLLTVAFSSKTSSNHLATVAGC